SAQTNPGLGHLFPFTNEITTDPFTGKKAGLLQRQRERGGMPKMMFLHTAAEYWRGDGSLSHTDPSGKSDAPEAPETRNYLFSSTQHMIGQIPLSDRVGSDRARHPLNIIDYTPLLRACLMSMDRWCREG